MDKLQDSYLHSVTYKNDAKEKENLARNPQEYKLIQGLYTEFKQLTHKEIFMYIMDIRDELLKSKYENNKLYSNYSNAKTELIMLKKFYQENSPLKYSKQKFDAIHKDYELLKKEVQ
jgi:hypothetical protein